MGAPWVEEQGPWRRSDRGRGSACETWCSGYDVWSTWWEWRQSRYTCGRTSAPACRRHVVCSPLPLSILTIQNLCKSSLLTVTHQSFQKHLMFNVCCVLLCVFLVEMSVLRHLLWCLKAWPCHIVCEHLFNFHRKNRWYSIKNILTT